MRILHHYFKSFKNHQKSFAIIFVGGILSLIIGPYFLLTRGACDCSSEICVLVSSATTLCSLQENLHFYLPNIVLWTCTKLMFNSLATSRRSPKSIKLLIYVTVMAWSHQQVK